MLRHYCEAGRMMGMGQILPLVMRSAELDVRDKLRVLLNNLAMMRIKDPDRRRILKQTPS